MRSQLLLAQVAILISQALGQHDLVRVSSNPIARDQKIDRNAQGKLPILGWNSWNAFRCDINEMKILAAANAIIDLGLKDLGYEYVNCVLRPCYFDVEKWPN